MDAHLAYRPTKTENLYSHFVRTASNGTQLHQTAHINLFAAIDGWMKMHRVYTKPRREDFALL